METNWNFLPNNNCNLSAINFANDSLFGKSEISHRIDNNMSDKNIANSLHFKPIDHIAMRKIWDILKYEPGRTTDFSYAGVLMWVDFFNYEYAIINDTLFIKGLVESDRNITAFSLPIGNMPLRDSVEMLKNYCDTTGIPLTFSAIPEYAIPYFKKLSPRNIEPLDNWSDYLYEATDLSYLKGKKYGKKRNHVNQFLTSYPNYELIKLNKENAHLAQKFMDQYDLEGDNSTMAIAERKLTRYLINCIAEGDELLTGMMLSVNNEICAITIGDIKGDTAFIHVEKALREYVGSYEFINKEFARYLLENNPKVVYINREDDAGDEGLRFAKQSYHPLTMLRKYNVWF